MIDSHAHLHDSSFDTDRAEVIKRAEDSGVRLIIDVGCDLPTSRAAVELADRYDFIYATVGVHPHDTREINDSTYEELQQLSRHRKVIAWGEIGLDYHYMNSPKEIQIQAFRDQIRLAKGIGLPIVIHTRDAQTDTLRILKEEEADQIGGVFHCYTGDLETAKAAMALNFMISFSGVITFPKAQNLQEVVKQVPLDKIMIETDCPYLTPVPYRGKRNEPAYVRQVSEKIVELKPSNSYEQVVIAATSNTQRVFKFPKLTV